MLAAGVTERIASGLHGALRADDRDQVAPQKASVVVHHGHLTVAFESTKIDRGTGGFSELLRGLCAIVFEFYRDVDQRLAAERAIANRKSLRRVGDVKPTFRERNHQQREQY